MKGLCKDPMKKNPVKSILRKQRKQRMQMMGRDALVLAQTR